MLKLIKKPIIGLFNSFGYTILPVKQLIPSGQKGNWAENLNINTIIDIGSNEGQFIREISNVLPGRRIFAFEPIKSCFEKLSVLSGNFELTAFNIGLSDSDETADIHISRNFTSSSLLEMKELHKQSYPGTDYIDKEQINLRRLDTLMSEYELTNNILIKVDVQGYEEKVLRGGDATFSKAAAIIIETIFEPFYDGQWLFDDIYKYFTDRNFKFMGFTDQSNSTITGIPLYADSIFIRKDLIHLIL